MQCPETPTPVGKASSGSLLSRRITLRRTSRPDVDGLKVNSKEGTKPGTFIGKLSSPSPRRALLPLFEACLETSTPNSLDLKPHANMCGKKTPELTELSLNLDPSLSESIQRPTGSKFGPPPSPVSSWLFPRIVEFQVTVRYEVFDLIMTRLSLWRESVMYSGDQLGLVKVAVHGRKLEWKLTVRIPELSFGAVTSLKEMLLSMNFEEESTFHTCCAGSIVIRSVWKLKEALCRSVLTSFGSPPI